MNGSSATTVVPVPVASNRSRYGWVIIGISALTMVATFPGRTQGLGLITEPLLKDLQISRLDYANINLWATLIGAAFCLPIGRLIDLFGVRLVTTVTVLATGIVTWWLGRLTGGYWLLFVAITLLRGFGQSALSVCSITSVGKWYSRNSGPAMAGYAILLGILFVAAFVIVPKDIYARGWRPAWGAVAFALIFVVAPLAAMFLRNGRGSEVVPEEEAEETSGPELTLNEALRTQTFWVFALATSFFGLAYAGLSLFGESILSQHGFDQKEYYNFMGVSMMAGLLAQLGVGWLSRKYPLGPITAVSLAVYALGLAMIPHVNGQGMLSLCGFVLGGAGGAITVVFFAVWSRAFGRKHLGRIQGAAQLLSVLASAFGPLLFAQCADRFGSYSPAIWTLVPIIVLLGAASWRIHLAPIVKPVEAKA